MQQKITGFHCDAEQQWVAELRCGHAQHVRHDPPWMERPWVTTEVGRGSRIGTELNCVRCDEAALAVAKAVATACRAALVDAYEDAGISGLCGEGRFEAALGALGAIDLRTVAEASLRKEFTDSRSLESS